MARKTNKQSLINFLQGQNPNEMVYIGTKSGTNWIVIDRVVSVIDNLDKHSKVHHDKQLRSLNIALGTIKRGPLKIIKLRADLEKLKGLSTVTEEEIKVAEKQIRIAENEFANAIKQRTKLNKILKEWKPLDERSVVESYPHEVDIPGVSVLIEGCESGESWFFLDNYADNQPVKRQRRHRKQTEVK